LGRESERAPPQKRGKGSAIVDRGEGTRGFWGKTTSPSSDKKTLFSRGRTFSETFRIFLVKEIFFEKASFRVYFSCGLSLTKSSYFEVLFSL